MKLYWAPDKKSVILVAETRYEKAFAELLCADLQAHKYSETRHSAKWSILPAEIIDKIEADKVSE